MMVEQIDEIPDVVWFIENRPKGTLIIETLTDWVEENGYDYSEVVKQLSPNIVQAIQDEAAKLNMLKGVKPAKRLNII